MNQYPPPSLEPKDTGSGNGGENGRGGSGGSSPIPVPPPKAMINLEFWIPPNAAVMGWKLADLGRLGPGGR